MNIYLVCKHRTFRDSWGDGIFKEYVIFDIYQSKALANFVVKDLNSRSKYIGILLKKWWLPYEISKKNNY